MCWTCYHAARGAGPDDSPGSRAAAPAFIPSPAEAPGEGARWHPRRAFLRAASAAAVGVVAAPALAQVDVGGASRLRTLVPAGELEAAATQEYSRLLQQAREKNALAPDDHPQLLRLRAIARRLIAHTARWNDRSAGWRWEINLIGSKQINAFCMPGGKIAFFTGLLDQLKLDDDETAVVMGHEMAHALREHARARIAKTRGTGMGLSMLSQVLGLGQLGDVAANIGTQLLSLKFSREDETDADLVGLELSARGAYQPEASVRLWEKMGRASGGGDGPAFLSTHPTGPERIARLRDNVPRVRGLYEQALAQRAAG